MRPWISDPAEKGAGMGSALKGGADEIGWPAHRRRQMANHLRFESCHGYQAGRRLGPGGRCEFCEVQTRRPCLGQGCRRGARKPGKVFDAIEVAKSAESAFVTAALRASGSIG